MTPGWYLLAYDVAGKRQLCNVHRQVRKSAYYLLDSLYLRQGQEAEQLAWLRQLRQMGAASARDIVQYRLLPAQPLHVFGTARPAPGIHLLGLPPLIVHGGLGRMQTEADDGSDG